MEVDAFKKSEAEMSPNFNPEWFPRVAIAHAFLVRRSQLVALVLQPVGCFGSSRLEQNWNGISILVVEGAILQLLPLLVRQNDVCVVTVFLQLSGFIGMGDIRTNHPEHHGKFKLKSFVSPLANNSVLGAMRIVGVLDQTPLLCFFFKSDRAFKT